MVLFLLNRSCFDINHCCFIDGLNDDVIFIAMKLPLYNHEPLADGFVEMKKKKRKKVSDTYIEKTLLIMIR